MCSFLGSRRNNNFEAGAAPAGGPAATAVVVVTIASKLFRSCCLSVPPCKCLGKK